MRRVVVIGAGVIGASVAFRLAQGGADVTVLEAGRPGGGTSSRSFAWTNSNNKTPRSYHALNAAGMRAHAGLAARFGATPWWHGGGCVEWKHGAEGDALVDKVGRLRDWDYAAELITRARLLEMEPGIDPAAVGDAPIAFYPDDGWLDPVLYIDAMLRAATGLGAKLRIHTPVAGLAMRGGRAAGVRTPAGETIAADLVVNCAGRWSNDPLEDAGVRVPLAPTVGVLVFTPPVAGGVSRVVRSPLVDLRPDGAGRLMLIRNNDDEAGVDPDAPPGPDHPLARSLIARTRALLPGIGDVQAEAVRVGVRPMPKDKLSCVGRVPRLDGYYVVVTHSGVTMSPFLGEAVADEVLHETDRPELADFRPARFFN
ncbi:MAG: FAD-binding oxidoreductase [Proteobacteria bacterium]|nr:FAD-binding oxidoreductase [Pseudomonadota bacterium]